MSQPLTYEDLYSEKAGNLKLCNALDLHYRFNPQFTPWFQYESEIGRPLIRAHDISHLVFGCDTSFKGELQVQLWTRFGVDMNISKQDRLKYLMDKDARSLLTPKGMILYTATHFFEILRQIRWVKKQATQMSHKWVYFKEDAYMDWTLDDIWKQFVIRRS